jgi:DNA-binding MarR family transcriptional regulator
VDEVSLAAFRALRDVMHANRQAMGRRFASVGAHPGQAGCLRVLADEDGITQSELAETLNVSRPSITVMLQAVERAGAIRRAPDANDQRLTRVYLTEVGRAQADEMRRVLAAYVMETLGAMSEKDRRELARLLGELNDRIGSSMSTGEAPTG